VADEVSSGRTGQLGHFMESLRYVEKSIEPLGKKGVNSFQPNILQFVIFASKVQQRLLVIAMTFSFVGSDSRHALRTSCHQFSALLQAAMAFEHKYSEGTSDSKTVWSV
jgi:hypothetical protein